MGNRFKKKLLAGLVVLVGIGGAGVPHGFAQSAVDRAKVLATNEAFYRSFEAGDLEGMRKVWSQNREIGMIPPGRTFLRGVESVMGAFALMMQRPPKISCDMEGPITFRDDKAIIICNEILERGESVRMMNVFAPEDVDSDGETDWRMLYHGPVPEGWRQI